MKRLTGQSKISGLTGPLSIPGISGYLNKEGSSGISTLDSIISSTVFDLDGGLTSSYPGSGQTWSNAVAAPADSSDPTDWDLYLGTDGNSDSTDPSFASEVFSLNGSQYFTGKTSGAPGFLGSLQRNDASNEFWVAISVFIPASFNSNGVLLASSNAIANAGFRLNFLTANGRNGVSLFQFTGATSERADLGEVTLNAWNLIVVTGNLANNTFKGAINSINFSPSFRSDNDFWANCSTDTSNPVRVGCSYASTPVPLTNGHKIRHLSGGNSVLSSAELDSLVTLLEARHGVTYRPTASRDTSSLDSLDVNAVFDIDVTLPSSYPGTGSTVYNLVSSPADGAAQSAYDFSLSGLSFEGVAGRESACLRDSGGTGYLKLLNSIANATMLNTMHRSDGTGYTIGIILDNVVEQSPSDQEYLWGTGSEDSDNSTFCFLGTSGDPHIVQSNGTTNDTTITGTSNNTNIPDRCPFMLVISFDFNTGTALTWNNNTGTAGQSNTLSPIATTTNVSPGGETFFLMAASRAGAAFKNPSGGWEAGAGFIAAFGINDYYDATKMALLEDFYNTRHRRVYLK